MPYYLHILGNQAYMGNLLVVRILKVKEPIEGPKGMNFYTL
jgi:hypothetical protein